MTSVFAAVSPRPRCISSPSLLKVLFMSWMPSIMSSLELKMKAPLSTYSIWRIANSSPLYRSFFLWPVSCPLINYSGVSKDTLLNSAFGFSAADHSASRVSAKAAIMNRKITGERLSPCLTPTFCGISDFSLPIFKITLRLVYNLLIASQSFGGAPNFSSIEIINV